MILHPSQFGIMGKCVNTFVVSHPFLFPNHAFLFGFSVRVSSRIGYNRKGFCLRMTVSSSFCFGSGTLLISGCIVVDHPF